MNLYDILAENYSELFPLDPARTDFVLKSAVESSKSGSLLILDLGCATGDLDFELAAAGAEVTGIDLNEKMIRIAGSRRDSRLPPDKYPVFFAGDMTGFTEFTGGRKFSAAVCFGNTLPHLEDGHTAARLFNSVCRELLLGGCFTVQILNYDRILKQRITDFPVVRTDSLIFTRSYRFLPDGRLRFTAELTEKETGISRSDSTSLLPFKREEILRFGKEAGFRELCCFDGYSENEAGEDSPVLLFRMKA